MVAHANPTTLLTRFAEELRRVLGRKGSRDEGVKEEGWKVQGGRLKFRIFNFGCWIVGRCELGKGALLRPALAGLRRVLAALEG